MNKQESVPTLAFLIRTYASIENLTAEYAESAKRIFIKYFLNILAQQKPSF